MMLNQLFVLGCLFTIGYSQVIWECDNWPVSDPIDGCDWERSHQHWGEENTDSVSDPDGRPGNALRLFYHQGSCVCHSDPADKGGTQFYAWGFPTSDDLILEYEIYFSPGFDFVLGGKLPGFFGGTGSCSGGGDDETCFSTRFHWRTDGAGEVYGYIPNETDDWFCERPDVVCNFEYGHSFGRGTFYFTPGVWHTLAQRIKLNVPGTTDGEIRIIFDGEEVFEISGLNFRNDDSLVIDQIYFSTFFGGGNPDYESTGDVYIYYRNMKVIRP